MGIPTVYSGTTAPPLSALQTLLAQNPQHASQHWNLALQVAHNLRFQHNWTDLRTHALPRDKDMHSERFVVSGLPPERLYIHPDEQIDLLQKQKNQGKSGMPQLDSEREWVVPSHLREKWSLRRLGQTFDAVEIVPDPADGTAIDFNTLLETSSTVESSSNPWRTIKRFLLATLDDDSTVVYYIVHDGLVKPRQN